MIGDGSGSGAKGLTATTCPSLTIGSKTPQWELFSAFFTSAYLFSPFAFLVNTPVNCSGARSFVPVALTDPFRR